MREAYARQNRKKLTKLKTQGQKEIVVDIYDTNDDYTRELDLASEKDE